MQSPSSKVQMPLAHVRPDPHIAAVVQAVPTVPPTVMPLSPPAPPIPPTAVPPPVRSFDSELEHATHNATSASDPYRSTLPLPNVNAVPCLDLTVDGMGRRREAPLSTSSKRHTTRFGGSFRE